MTVASPPIQRAVCGHPRRLHGGRLHRASGVLSVPARQHQAISLFLFLALYFFVRDIGGKFREPDLLLVTDAEGHRCRNDHRVGAGLVVKVMSPDSADRDLIDKRMDYAEVGIPGYWSA